MHKKRTGLRFEKIRQYLFDLKTLEKKESRTIYLNQNFLKCFPICIFRLFFWMFLRSIAHFAKCSVHLNVFAKCFAKRNVTYIISTSKSFLRIIAYFAKRIVYLKFIQICWFGQVFKLRRLKQEALSLLFFILNISIGIHQSSSGTDVDWKKTVTFLASC